MDREAVSDAEERAPGWYPDPSHQGRFRYWNGANWAYAARGGVTSRSQVIVGIGAAALAISPFFSWVSVVLVGSLNLFQLLRVTGHPPTLAWFTVAVGIGAALGVWLAATEAQARNIGLAVGFGGGILVAGGLIYLVHEVGRTAGVASVSVGPLVALAGCAAMAVGGLISDPPGRSVRMEQELRGLREAGALTADEHERAVERLRGGPS